VNSIPTIVIVGFMGSGKTAVAQSLAAQLNLPLIDLDKFITDNVGRTPAQIITQEGERAFRIVENLALTKILRQAQTNVIALGGGTWIEEANRKLIMQHKCFTVWLDTPFDECWRRIESSTEYRPLGRSEEQAKELFERRRPVYELATLHVKVLPDETVDALAARIKVKIRARLNT
jgi:shikimate kinase